MLFLTFVLACLALQLPDNPGPRALERTLTRTLSSDDACQRLLEAYAILNADRFCRPGVPSAHIELAVQSHSARWSGSTIRIECQVTNAYDGCSRRFLQVGLIGPFYVLCHDGFKPHFENGKLVCLPERAGIKIANGHGKVLGLEMPRFMRIASGMSGCMDVSSVL